MLKFEDEYKRFIGDDSARDALLLSLSRMIKDRKEAEDFMFEAMDDLFIDNFKKPIIIESSFIKFAIKTVRNKWIDKYRKTKKHRIIDIDSTTLLETLGYSEKNYEEIKHKEIINANTLYIYNHIQDYIPDSLKRRVFVDHYYKKIEYEFIVNSIKKLGFMNSSGKPHDTLSLRVMNNRTKKDIKKKIKAKYPHFSMKLIEDDGEKN